MATLSELTRQHTTLDQGDRAHLRRLVGSWALMADLSFSDLILFGKTDAGSTG